MEYTSSFSPQPPRPAIGPSLGHTSAPVAQVHHLSWLYYPSITMASPASHKPRRRRKIEDGSLAHVTHGTLSVSHDSSAARKPAFPLVAFLWPAKGTVSQWVTMPLILMAVGLFRWTVGLWGYSGFESPPMHGDFEAQRHWMEITKHLPVSRWYFYELEWWGLDYPPLTAYHSWLLGVM